MGADKNLSLRHLVVSNNWGNGIPVAVSGTGISTNHATTTGGTHSGAGTATITISSGSGVLVAYVGGYKASVTWATSDNATATALAAALAAIPAVAALASTVASTDTVVVTGIENGDMANTITSPAMSALTLDDMSFQMVWSTGGDVKGAFDFQVSNSYQQSGANVINAGTWTSLTLATPLVAPGDDSYLSAFANFGALSAAWVRVVYTPDGGAPGFGLLDVYFCGRSI